jgi:hypothetical protein
MELIGDIIEAVEVIIDDDPLGIDRPPRHYSPARRRRTV